MGAFNRVAAPPAPCRNCGIVVQRQVQFKFGLCRQLDFVIGERVAPGHDDDAALYPAHLLVDGAPEGCPVCHYEAPEEEVFAVEIDGGLIVGVSEAGPPLARRLLAEHVVRLR